MKKLLFICVALSFFVMGCDDDSINAPESIVGNSYYGEFDKDDVKNATAGMFESYDIYYMELTFNFTSETRFTLYGYVKSRSRSGRTEVGGSYTYNPKSGKLNLHYDESYMGIDSDKAFIKGNTMYLGSTVRNYPLRKRRK